MSVLQHCRIATAFVLFFGSAATTSSVALYRPPLLKSVDKAYFTFLIYIKKNFKNNLLTF